MYDTYATGIKYSAYKNNYQSPWYTSMLSNELKKYYETVTGKKGGTSTFDINVKVDSRHKGSSYSSYLWLDKDEKIVETPIIYSGDNVTIGTINLFTWNYTPLITLEIKGSKLASAEHQNLFKEKEKW